MRSNQRCGAVTSSIASNPPGASSCRTWPSVRRRSAVAWMTLAAITTSKLPGVEALRDDSRSRSSTAIAHDGVSREALARSGDEQRADVGEGVFDAVGGQARQHVRGGAAGAGADLEHAQRRGPSSPPRPAPRPPGRCRTSPSASRGRGARRSRANRRGTAAPPDRVRHAAPRRVPQATRCVSSSSAAAAGNCARSAHRCRLGIDRRQRPCHAPTLRSSRVRRPISARMSSRRPNRRRWRASDAETRRQRRHLHDLAGRRRPAEALHGEHDVVGAQRFELRQEGVVAVEARASPQGRPRPGRRSRRSERHRPAPMPTPRPASPRATPPRTNASSSQRSPSRASASRETGCSCTSTSSASTAPSLSNTATSARRERAGAGPQRSRDQAPGGAAPVQRHAGDTDRQVELAVGIVAPTPPPAPAGTRRAAPGACPTPTPRPAARVRARPRRAPARRRATAAASTGTRCRSRGRALRSPA